MSKRKPGRPTKFSFELAEKIVQAVRAGVFLETAAAFAGISKVTLHGWLKKGARARKGDLHEFQVRVEQAIAEAEVRAVNTIQRAAQGITDKEGNIVERPDWKAASWYLERKHNKRWGKRDTRTIEGNPDKPIVTGLKVSILPSNVTDSEGRVLRQGGGALPAPVEDATLATIPVIAPTVVDVVATEVVGTA